MHDVDVDEMRVDVRKGRGEEEMSPIELAEVRVDEVIKGVRRTGRHEEDQVVEIGCRVNAMIRELCQVAEVNGGQDEEEGFEEEWQEEAWDDVKGVSLPSELVKAEQAAEWNVDDQARKGVQGKDRKGAGVSEMGVEGLRCPIQASR